VREVQRVMTRQPSLPLGLRDRHADRKAYIQAKLAGLEARQKIRELRRQRRKEWKQRNSVRTDAVQLSLELRESYREIYPELAETGKANG
jgi:hypothetical protein